MQEHCLNHQIREAVARCPECEHFFCRECITEHDDRVICAACLKRVIQKLEIKHERFAGVVRIFQCMFGVLIAWVFFFVLGRLLLTIPDSFHEGTLWFSM